jgi:NAD(P)H-nitrite reductase large subunit
LPEEKTGKALQRNMEPKDEDMREATEALREWEDPTLAEETLICECYCVSVLDIKQTCGATGSVDLELLGQEFGLGTGCGQCVNDFANWKNLVF